MSSPNSSESFPARIYYRFFSPPAKRQEAFETHLLNRFSNREHAVDYIARILDRQISKANGLLAFDGLLFAALSIIRPESGPVPVSIRIGSAFALLASISLLLLFVVQFGGVGNYRDAEADFRAACKIIYSRTNTIALSVLCSLVASIALIWRLW